MNKQVKFVLVVLVVFLVISDCFISPVCAKKKKKSKVDVELKGKTTKPGKTKVIEPKYDVRGGDGEELDPESMAKIQARIKEKGYGDIIRDHQSGKITDDDPVYVDMLDDLVKQTVKIELTPLGTEIIEERALTPEEVEIEERRQAEEERMYRNSGEDYQYPSKNEPKDEL